MKRPARRVVFLPLTFAMLLMAASYHPALASNMGFRINHPISLAGTGQIGSNWVALPFLNPYPTAAAFCQATGLTSAGLSRATIADIDPSTGDFKIVSCGTAAAAALVFIPGQCIRVRQPPVAGAPTSILIVGSHDPDLQITIGKAGAGQIGNLWYAFPYHSSDKTINDFCSGAGLTSSGINRATCVQLNAVTGTFSLVTCGTTAGTSPIPSFGYCARLREPNGPKTFLPRTF